MKIVIAMGTGNAVQTTAGLKFVLYQVSQGIHQHSFDGMIGAKRRGVQPPYDITIWKTTVLFHVRLTSERGTGGGGVGNQPQTMI